MENHVEFLKEAHNDALQWYKQADTKAQVILASTGVFTIIVAALFGRSGLVTEVSKPVLILPIVFYCASILLCMNALWSRGIFDFFNRKKRITFFGYIANYYRGRKQHHLEESVAELRMAITCTISDPVKYIGELCEDVLILSRNTKKKHRRVDLAVFSSALGLLSTVYVLLHGVLWKTIYSTIQLLY